VRLSILAKPRAKKSRVIRAHGLSLDVQIAAPPVDGAANEVLLEVLSSALGVPKRALTIIAGAGGKRKVVEVTGLREAEATERLARACSVR
jgi:uncharacterized protein YggU (UPF0235/DUF167 family)